MTPEIRTTPLTATLLGHSTRHDPAKRYGQEIVALLDRVWPVVRQRAVPNKGINWVVYEPGDRIFAGIESSADPAALGMEARNVHIARYATFKHIGPYSLLGQTSAEPRKAVESQGLRPSGLLIEIYGHWTSDESKLETDIVLELQ